MRWLSCIPVLLAFLVVHLASCSFTVGQSPSQEHHPAALAAHAQHGPAPDTPGGECEHHQHGDTADEVCVTVTTPRPDPLPAAGVAPLPAALIAPAPPVPSCTAGPAGSGDGGTPAEPRAGRHLLIAVNVART